ncbi:hypothetical protein ACF08N_02705 [Streptomyces sp. NPDC015127]|uniref:hypothetical protein n=1 Tax=Streptomyces sp. NPDC015127 TaxID=3364939 RepID=UPI0036FF822B
MTDNATAARSAQGARETASDPGVPEDGTLLSAAQDAGDTGALGGQDDADAAHEADDAPRDTRAHDADDAPRGEGGGAWRRLRGAVGRGARTRWTAVGLAVATVAVTAVSGWLCVQVYEQRAEGRRHQDILAAARQSALNFTSLDYRHYERDSANVLKGATGDFKEQFAAQTAELTKLVAANKSVSQGQVLEAGIARADERSARVLVVADSKVTNTAAPEGQARTYRLQLDLVLEGGRWLTSNVEFVG